MSTGEAMLAQAEQGPASGNSSSTINRCGPGNTVVGGLCVQPTNAAGGAGCRPCLRWGLAAVASVAAAAAVLLV
jgi:hypothetical protein